MEKLYLASASPRRVELLTILGIPFEQKISKVSEALPQGAEPGAYAEALAVAKARDVAMELEEGLVIGADTIVVFEEEILGKPQDALDAIRMLRLLNGAKHQVISGVAVVNAKTGQEISSHEVTAVTFCSLADEEILCYVGTGEPKDKAGAYGIQGIGAILVKDICGCYNNVVGLPLTLLTQLLKNMGINVWSIIREEESWGGTT